MTTTTTPIVYTLPAEPDGPVWTPTGARYERDGAIWYLDGRGGVPGLEWHELLRAYGRLYSEHPDQ